ncbi:hypothetical protein SLEP1_g35921 [Rubroshorea leprosula]|uniref:Uncharacterized protein n=1 Tax=Rubroshorea leprosula TaxID=152421 RepID=A0AAV5KQA5_9ROSI|nr:hypothetical protein SLEP1_g35921 [Rubroshorea leprosula]
MNVDEEVGRLKEEIQRLGKIQPDGSYKVIPFSFYRNHRQFSFHFNLDLSCYINVNVGSEIFHQSSFMSMRLMRSNLKISS